LITIDKAVIASKTSAAPFQEESESLTDVDITEKSSSGTMRRLNGYWACP
jgi:hypothetical protein